MNDHEDRNDNTLSPEIAAIYLKHGMNPDLDNGCTQGNWSHQWRHTKINIDCISYYLPTLSDERRKWAKVYMAQLVEKMGQEV